MNLSKLMVVCAVALGGLAVGCGNKCKSVCDDQTKCPDGALPNGMTCDKFCDDVDKVSDASSCGSQKDDLLSCEDDMKDKCSTTDTSCDSKSTAWATCISTYCTAHPDNSDCTKFFTDLGGST